MAVKDTKMRIARINKKLTLEDMANLLGYKSKSGYAMIESGRNNLSLATATKIAEILDLEVHELLEEVEVHDSRTTA